MHIHIYMYIYICICTYVYKISLSLSRYVYKWPLAFMKVVSHHFMIFRQQMHTGYEMDDYLGRYHMEALARRGSNTDWVRFMGNQRRFDNRFNTCANLFTSRRRHR